MSDEEYYDLFTGMGGGNGGPGGANPNNPLGDDFGGAFDDGTGVYYNIIQLHQIGKKYSFVSLWSIKSVYGS